MGWRDAPEVEDSGGSWKDAPLVGEDSAPAAQGEVQSLPKALLNNVIGAADVGISSLRGLVNKPALTLRGIVGGINPNDTYLGAQQRGRQEIDSGQGLVNSEQLRTPQGQELAGRISNAAQYTGIPQALNYAGNKIEQYLGPEARDVAGSAATLASLGLGRFAAPAAEAAPKPMAAPFGPKSVGAAAAAADLTSVSPELRQAVQKAGPRVNDAALDRHVDADTLTVPVRLTEGQATQDPISISNEMNMRGKAKPIAERLDQQNKALGANVEELRNQIGENVFTTNPVEHADTIIGDYKARDARANGRITQLYQRLRDANGGQFPVDAQALLDSATSKLHEKLLFDHAPPEVMKTLNRLADKGMTFENFESLRTNLARIQRSSTVDGNVKAAAGVIRNAMEELPLEPGAADLKPLADQARNMAKQRFDALEADPAYKAAVEGVEPDRFVRKYIISAPRSDVATMMRDASPETRATIRTAVLDHLREQAKLDSNFSGNFSAAGYNKALTALEPKLGDIFEPKDIEQIRKLGRVSKYVTNQPRGSFVNNSNTLVANMANHAMNVGEGVMNVATLGVPTGTWTRRLIENLQTDNEANKILAPGAGVRLPKK